MTNINNGTGERRSAISAKTTQQTPGNERVAAATAALPTRRHVGPPPRHPIAREETMTKEDEHLFDTQDHSDLRKSFVMSGDSDYRFDDMSR